MLRVNRNLVIISAIVFMVHHHRGDAAFLRSTSVLQGSAAAAAARGYNRQQYSNNLNYKSSAAAAGSNLGGITNQGYAHSAAGELKSDVVRNRNDSKGGNAHAAFSAWGIVAIIIGFILLGTGGYYAFVFYPFICRKERNYDMIELTHVL